MDNNEANRRKGWQRISLFAIYFRPSAISMVGLGETLHDAINSPDRSPKAYFGLFPFRWKENWKQSFDALRGQGRPFVAPILQTLIFPQAPLQVLDWADKVATWDFQQIISCHFDSPIEVGSREFRSCFDFLEKKGIQHLPEEDVKFIRELEATLVQRGIAKPGAELWALLN